MSVFESSMSRRTLGGVALGAAATTGLAYLVSAQDATPSADEATPETAPTLAELETVTQIGIAVTNGSFGIYGGSENQPGWFVFQVENGSDADASFNLAQLPEGMSVSDFNSAVFKTISGTEVSTFEGVTFAGGTTVAAGGAASVLVNLSAGEWVIFSAHAASKQSSTTIKVLTPEETVYMGSEPVATPEGGELAPEGFGSNFTVSVSESAISADAMPSAGLNTIGVRNDGSGPANLVVLNSTESVDAAAAVDLAKSWIAGEEVGATVVGGMGVLSPDKYGYFELTVTGGTYVAFSALANADGSLQVDGGAIIVVPTM
jgi:hypothetical protein